MNIQQSCDFLLLLLGCQQVCNLDPSLHDGHLLAALLILLITEGPTPFEFSTQSGRPELNPGGDHIGGVVWVEFLTHEMKTSAHLGRRRLVIHETNDATGLGNKLSTDARARQSRLEDGHGHSCTVELFCQYRQTAVPVLDVR